MFTSGTIRSGTFRLIWAGQSVSVIGDAAAALAVPLLVLRESGSPALAAFAASPRAAAYLVSGLFAGPLIDRRDCRRMMLACDLIRCALFACMPFAGQLRYGVPVVLVMAFSAASADVVFETGSAIAIQRVLQPTELVSGNARLELSNQLGLLLGPTVVGVAIAGFGVGSAMWADAATFLVSAATLLVIRIPPAEAPSSQSTTGVRARRPSLVHEMRDGFRYIRSNTLLLRLVLLQAIVNFVVAVESLIVYYVTVNLRASSSWSGLVLAAAGLGGICASAAAGRLARRYAAPKLIGAAMLGIVGTLLALALSVDPLILAAANLLHGGVCVFGSIQIRALRQAIVPGALMGRVTATSRSIALAAYPLGTLMFGLLTTAAGGNARWSFLSAALLGLVTAAGVIRSLAPAATAVPSSEGTL